MNAKHEIKQRKAAPSDPIFASTWVALFLVIRREFMNPRSTG